MTEQQRSERLPTVFIAHGAPPLLDDSRWVAELHQWAQSLPKSKAILMLSAHWENRPELAERIRKELKNTQPVADDPQRGLDHGAYVPLVAMYPDADVPVLQISLPSENPRELFALGRGLRALRDEGVLIIGSGFITHNLRTLDWSGQSATPSWATEFDAWTADALSRRDVDALLDYEKKGPATRIALPTREHFVPLLVNLGAAAEGENVEFPITGFWMGSLARRSVQFG